MNPGKIIIATSFLSAVLVLGAVAPLGYFGLQILNKKLDDGQSEVRRVVIELKTEAIAEIKASAAQASGNNVSADGEPVPAIMDSLQQLQSNVDDLRQGQQQLIETIATGPAALAPVATPTGVETTEEGLNQTVLFPMGKIKGPGIDEQISAMAVEIVDYGQNRTCVSDVMGHSDTLGGDKGNLKLSKDRARHVASILRGKQIQVGKVIGWGERWLKIHTVDGIQNQQNRRVVVETVCDGTAPSAATVS